MRTFRAAFCNMPEPPGDAGLNARAFIRRNVLQVVAAKRAALGEKLLASPTWCADSVLPGAGPEWFLKIRDSLLQTAVPQ